MLGERNAGDHRSAEDRLLPLCLPTTASAWSASPRPAHRHHWDAGTRLIVEDTPQGVLLRAARIFEPTRPEDVFGSVKVAGPPKTLADMDAGIAAEAKRRYARD